MGAARRIGLLGGSFNPAHQGHLDISLAALKYLDLDEVWWLVSPQNPLKPVAGMAPFADRMASARAMARHPRIRVTDLEARIGTRFTADTLKALDAVSRLPVRLADGGRQPGADLLLAGLDQNLSSHANCGFRPSFLYY